MQTYKDIQDFKVIELKITEEKKLAVSEYNIKIRRNDPNN